MRLSAAFGAALPHYRRRVVREQVLQPTAQQDDHMNMTSRSPRRAAAHVLLPVVLTVLSGVIFAGIAVGFLPAQSTDLAFEEPDGRAAPERIRMPTLPEPILRDPTLPDRAEETTDAESPGSARSAGLAELRLPEPQLPSVGSSMSAGLPDAAWPRLDPASPIFDRQVVAFYGHPLSTQMGILGERSIEETGRALHRLAAEYDSLNGTVGVLPAFHLVYATAFVDGRVGRLDESVVRQYIEYAAEHGYLVFLDHQIGRGSVAAAVTEMLPYLEFDNVHLALDPEWATERPGSVIGSVSGAELNTAQGLIQEYIDEHRLPGKKLLIVHQFSRGMISDRQSIRTDFPDVELIHNADGFGTPANKIATWEANALAVNMPLKGFKLFLPKSWRAFGFDEPLMSPHEVLSLDPVPVYIQYQ